MNKVEIHTEALTKRDRTYFFDIKKSKNDALYLKITESKKTKDSFERRQIIVFEEDLGDFYKVFKKSFNKFKELKEPNKIGNKAYFVEKIRKEYKQAYFPWTAENDNKLELLFCEGKSVKELALIFERNEGAIHSRIKKLELIDKYGDQPLQ